MTAPTSSYAAQGALTDPGALASALDGLPDDLPGLCRVVQGVLLHDSFGGRLYGPPPAAFRAASRETLPVAERLAAILASDPAPLTVPRPPFERSVGTCRDFALLLCAALRHRGVPARLRCGFATYFIPGFHEDHWACEAWRAEAGRAEAWRSGAGRWATVDAQLDPAHRADLDIDFDPADVPPLRFLPAWRAWTLLRSGAAPPESFGHGDTTGAWFVAVNLARDLLALGGREVSAWDGWRAAGPRHRLLDAEAEAHCDRIAALSRAATPEAPAEPAAGDRDWLETPFWLA